MDGKKFRKEFYENKLQRHFKASRFHFNLSNLISTAPNNAASESDFNGGQNFNSVSLHDSFADGNWPQYTGPMPDVYVLLFG